MRPQDDKPGNDSSAAKEAMEEVSITEASPEVLEELTKLFSGSRATNDHGTVDHRIDDHGADEPGTAESGIFEVSGVPSDVGTASVDGAGEDVERHDATPMGEVVSIVDAGVHDPTPGPPDPLIKTLINDSAATDVALDRNDTVVIVDDDMDRVVIVDDDRPDPRFEERQRRQKRRERLRRVKWVKLTVMVAVAVTVVMAILGSSLFGIRSVVFEGNVYMSDATVEAVTGMLEGASVFSVDTAAAREAVLKDPWVAEVRITTSLRRTALVEVAERVPVVWYVGEDQKARVVDARGFIIATLEGWPTGYLQVVGTGPSLAAGSYADDVYRAAAQLVLALPDELRGRVKSLELSAGGELSMNLTGGTIVRFGPPTDLQNKLVAVVVLFRRQDPGTLLVVDVSTGSPTVQVK